MSVVEDAKVIALHASREGGAAFEDVIFADPDPDGDPDEAYGRKVERSDAALTYAQRMGWIKRGSGSASPLWYATPKGRVAAGRSAR